jgi:methionyl-tRNA synthetase
MACAQCGAAEQRGRFCVGCGKAVAPTTHAAPRPRSPLADELTQPVLRLERPSKPAVPAR